MKFNQRQKIKKLWYQLYAFAVGGHVIFYSNGEEFGFGVMQEYYDPIHGSIRRQVKYRNEIRQLGEQGDNRYSFKWIFLSKSKQVEYILKMSSSIKD